MVYIVDWLSFTTKKYSYETIIELLNLPMVNWSSIQGFYGYQYSLFYEGIRIHYNDDKNGCFVNFSGQGCRTFETISPLDWYWLFEMLTMEEDEFNITRIDVACDEKDGILPLKKIADITNKFIAGDTENVCTKFSWADVNNSSQGLSVYYGSPKSDIRVRIYDKAAERGLADQHWIRVELQIRNNLAKNMILSILHLKDVGKSFCGVVNNYIRFIKIDHTRKEKCSFLQWWSRFVQTAEKIKIFISVGVEYNLQRIENYLNNQVGNSLQTYVKCKDGVIDDLMKIITKPRNLSKKQKDLIISYTEGEG